MPVNREAPLRLFHNGEKITDATILGTYHQEGKADSSKHFVLKLHSIKIAYFIKARKSLMWLFLLLTAMRGREASANIL
ncbi:hypothetical protein [Legionella sp.]|uniref:hypothetical protein n=1 Tax=Legionella sp. TaxID=459 RepID=UPI00321F93F7